MRTDSEVVEQYAEAWRQGVEFPPVELFTLDGRTHWIGDGIHRIKGADKAGRSSVLAIVHQGDERAARMFACGANRNHGLHRSNADKRRAAEIMLELEPTWSNSKIAQHCGISDMLVSDVRRSLESAEVISPSPVREGKDGKKQLAQRPRRESQVQESGTCDTPDAPDDFDPEAIESSEVWIDIDLKAEVYRRAINDLARIARDMKALAEDEKEGAYLAVKIVRITGDLEGARTAIRMAEPVAVCDACEGEGCRGCQKTGWLSRMVVESRKEI